MLRRIYEKAVVCMIKRRRLEVVCQRSNCGIEGLEESRRCKTKSLWRSGWLEVNTAPDDGVRKN